MAKQNVSEMLQEVEKDFAAKQEELQNQFAKKRQDLINKVLAEFSEKMGEANKVLAALPVEARSNALRDDSVKEFFKLTTPKLPKASGRTGRTPAVSEAQILEFLTTERSTKDIQQKFGWSAPTFNKYLNPLVTAKKVSATDTRPKIYKKL
jgi:hypothetical protein